MDIYSLEFGLKPVDWFLNEFKDMNFLGTQSRKFVSNRNFIKLDASVPTDRITFQPSSYFRPAIQIPFNGVVISQSEDMNCCLVENHSDDSEYLLATIIIDSDYFRLIDYTIGVNDATGTGGVFPEVIKIANHDGERGTGIRVALVQFDIKASPEQVLILVLFNRIYKTYEYYNIYPMDGKLICENATKEVGKKVMEEWGETDKREKFKNAEFGLTINYPATKFYITTNEYYNELNELLKTLNPSLHPVIITVSEDDSDNDINEAILRRKGKHTKAVTFYGMDRRMNLRKAEIEYIFIMDVTGLIMT